MADKRQGIPTAGTDTAGDETVRARPGAPGRDARTRDARTRDARLKAALKANIARRKARAQAVDGDDSATPGDPAPSEKD